METEEKNLYNLETEQFRRAAVGRGNLGVGVPANHRCCKSNIAMAATIGNVKQGAFLEAFASEASLDLGSPKMGDFLPTIFVA